MLDTAGSVIGYGRHACGVSGSESRDVLRTAGMDQTARAGPIRGVQSFDPRRQHVGPKGALSGLRCSVPHTCDVGRVGTYPSLARGGAGVSVGPADNANLPGK